VILDLLASKVLLDSQAKLDRWDSQESRVLRVQVAHRVSKAVLVSKASKVHRAL